MAEKDSSIEIERIYVVPLRRIKNGRTSLAAPRAVKQVRGYLTKHMKVDRENIWIDGSLNKELWSKGKYKIPSKIRVRAIKFDDGIVEVTLPEIGVKKSRREILKEEKEKKAPILRKEEAGLTEEAAGPGTEDYEISPTADGEVKIKKKKAPKETKAKEKKEVKKKSTSIGKKKTTKVTEKKEGKKTVKKSKTNKEKKKEPKPAKKQKTTPKKSKK